MSWMISTCAQAYICDLSREIGILIVSQCPRLRSFEAEHQTPGGVVFALVADDRESRLPMSTGVPAVSLARRLPHLTSLHATTTTTTSRWHTLVLVRREVTYATVCTSRLSSSLTTRRPNPPYLLRPPRARENERRQHMTSHETGLCDNPSTR